MTRPKILITNADRNGKVYEPTKWFVQIGKAKRVFNQAAWEQGGIAWLNKHVKGEE